MKAGLHWCVRSRALLPFGPLLVMVACATGENLEDSSSEGFDSGVGSGGAANNGGVASYSGGAMNAGAGTSTGGTQVGGASGTGATASAGGTPNSGGATNTGGAATTGGSTNAGGTPNSGGATNTGGAATTGGAANTGGAATTGGSTNTGGTPNTGGSTNTGGTPNTGGATNTGGVANTGGASGCANQDGDRYTECEEDADNVLSTSKSVWNGLTASLIGGNGGGNCTEICLASQIASLFANPIETHAIYSGWEFNTDQPVSQSPSSAAFGFQPPFTSTVTGWRMLYRGLFWVPPSATGQYCFNVDIGSDGGSGTSDTSPDACGAIYLPDVQANAWVMNGRHQSSTSDSPPMPSESNQRTKCTTFATAGGKRIDFVYQYSGNNADNRHQMHVKYCYGNASSCTPTTLIDDTVLTQVNATIP
jgi:hypothetical protein